MSKKTQELINRAVHGNDHIDPEAQHHLGKMYLRGKGVGRDIEKAIKWLTLAAENGHKYAQYDLGEMYCDGDGVAQDDEQAVKWLTLAAEQGYPKAQYNLGWMYCYRDGVAQDYKQAVKWYTLAAEQGRIGAHYELAFIFYYGKKGVPQDYEEAYKWFDRIVKNIGENEESAEALYYLGCMHANGEHVVQDYREATELLILAADLGSNEAFYKLENGISGECYE